nr:hypothetical protein CFP56_62146 [Quercus suber]
MPPVELHDGADQNIVPSGALLLLPIANHPGHGLGHGPALHPHPHPPKLPAHASLALAVCIVTSRPQDVSVRGTNGHHLPGPCLTHTMSCHALPPDLTLLPEYIALLRRHIAKGRRENAISAAYRHLDRSAFWRSESERLRDVCAAKEDEIFRLNQELEIVKLKSQAAKVAAPSKKRKKPDPDVILVPRTPKRPRTPKSPGPIPTLCTDLAQEFRFPGSDKPGDLFMATLFRIKCLLGPRGSTDPRGLYAHLIRAASALPGIFSSRGVAADGTVKSSVPCISASGRENAMPCTVFLVRMPHDAMHRVSRTDATRCPWPFAI